MAVASLSRHNSAIQRKLHSSSKQGGGDGDGDLSLSLHLSLAADLAALAPRAHTVHYAK